jgi:hypothetical protein
MHIVGYTKVVLLDRVVRFHPAAKGSHNIDLTVAMSIRMTDPRDALVPASYEYDQNGDFVSAIARIRHAIYKGSRICEGCGSRPSFRCRLGFSSELVSINSRTEHKQEVSWTGNFQPVIHLREIFDRRLSNCYALPPRSMTAVTSPEITRLLIDWSKGDESALERLLPLVERDLRRLAHSYMRRENPDHI